MKRTRTDFDEDFTPRLLNVAAALVGSAVVGGAVSMNAADKAASASANATAAQSAAAGSASALGQDQLAWDKTQYYDQKPIRDQSSQAALDLMQQQSALAKKQGDIASNYDAYNTSTFRPLEQSIVSNAEGYDTPERRAAAAAEARANVEGAYDSAQGGLARSLARTGNTYGSGRSQSLMQDAALSKAGAIAGATTGATRNVETVGNARMLDAANLGRNLPSSQATAASTAINASNSAVNSGTAAINDAAAGLAPVNAGYAGAIGGAGTAGQLYGQVASQYQRNAANDTAWMQGLGQAAGNWAGTNAGSTALAGWLSDKKKKKGTGKMLSGAKALKSIEDTPVHEGWQYDPAKGGPDEGGATHDGPMAQDVAENMPEASDGKSIDPVSMNGRVMAGMQELSKRVKRVEKKVA